MAKRRTSVIGGVDTHKDVHVAAVIDEVGKILDTAQFAATSKGYCELVSWMTNFGDVVRVGVEGTGDYGAGAARHLIRAGIEVVEVNRPNRAMRRRRGKSDTIDAEAAARAALNGQATVRPKVKAEDGIIESIRVLRVAFTSARDARTRVALQIRDLIVTAPEPLREVLGPLETAHRVTHCAHLRLGADASDSLEGTKLALRTLARRYEALSEEMAQLTSTLDELTAKANPALRGAKGVGPDVAAILLTAAGDNPERLRGEAAFAALCGVNPIEASSGRIVRHRLNRSGNRQANHALWRIVMVRMTQDQRTMDYIARRISEGKTKREAIRCLKRYVAREVYALIAHPPVVPAGAQLRTARQRGGWSLQTVADALGVWPTRISALERSLTHDTDLARRYACWLEANEPREVLPQAA
jgi:transposase